MKVYDCFLFHDEAMLLEIRLNILDKYVDKYVDKKSGRKQGSKTRSKTIMGDGRHVYFG